MRFNTATLVACVALGYVLCAAATPLEHADIDALFAHTSEPLADGRTRVAHSYHYTHPEHGTFVKKTMTGVAATHLYAVVSIDGAASGVQFAQPNAEGVSVMTVTGPTAALRAQLVARTKRVVVVSSQFRDEKGRGLMHHVVADVSTTETTVTLTVTAAAYADLFEELNLSYGTDHMLHSGSQESAQQEDVQYPGELSATAGAASRKAGSLGIWDWLKTQVSVDNVVASVKDTLQKLGVDALASANVVLTGGALNLERQYSLGVLTFNRAASTSFENVTSKWAVSTGNVKFGVSAMVTLTMQLGVSIEKFSFKNQSLSFAGQYRAELIFDALPKLGTLLQTDADGQTSPFVVETITLTKLAIKPINFRLGPVPVTINAQMPIQAGYNVSGSAGWDSQIDFAVAATGTFVIGYVIDNTRPTGKFRVLPPNANFKYTARVGGAPNADLNAIFYVQPDITAAVNFIGGGAATLRLTAEAAVRVAKKPAEGEPAPECPVQVSITALPIFTATSKIEVKAMGKVFFGPQVTGPQVVYTDFLQLVRVCSQLPDLGKVFQPSSAQHTPSEADVATMYSSSSDSCPRTVSMQVGAVSGSSMTMYVTMAHTSEMGVSVTQQEFAVTRKERTMSFVHTPSALDFRGDESAVMIPAFEGELSNDGDAITVRRLGDCSDVVARRPKMTYVASKPRSTPRATVVVASAAGAACLVAIVVASVLIVRRRRAAPSELAEAMA
jgi:hypothetical protein